MIARSMIKPSAFWIRKKEIRDDKLILYIRPRWDIRQIEVDDMNGQSHTEYEYEEVEFKLNIDIDEFDDTKKLKTQVKDYLVANKDILIGKVKKLIKLKEEVDDIDL